LSTHQNAASRARYVCPFDLPRPRSHGTAKDPAYGALFERIYGLLRDEVMRAMVGERTGA